MSNFRLVNLYNTSWTAKFFGILIGPVRTDLNIQNININSNNNNVYVLTNKLFKKLKYITSRQKLNQSTTVEEEMPSSSSKSSCRGGRSIKKHATILQIVVRFKLLWPNQEPTFALFS